jgi:hypothetical protein
MESRMTYKSLAAAALFAALIPSSAFAKSARCFTTDDGYFSCRFKATDRRGSFDISSRSTPAYSLIVERRGFASVFVKFGNRSIPINGMFVRQRDDPACWNNPEMNVKLCVW